MGMIEKARYIELLRKRKVVENDKKKIQAVIEELMSRRSPSSTNLDQGESRLRFYLLYASAWSKGC
jgi:hypothetical protein